MELVNIALRRFLHNYDNIARKGSPESGLGPQMPYSYEMTSTVL